MNDINRGPLTDQSQQPADWDAGTVQTIARGEEILDQARQVARTIEERVHHVIQVIRDERGEVRTRPAKDGP